MAQTTDEEALQDDVIIADMHIDIIHLLGAITDIHMPPTAPSHILLRMLPFEILAHPTAMASASSATSHLWVTTRHPRALLAHVPQ